jgi:hypothetical protein
MVRFPPSLIVVKLLNNILSARFLFFVAENEPQICAHCLPTLRTDYTDRVKKSVKSVQSVVGFLVLA